MADEEQAAAIPEWVVTFGDMMSLLLTFFIMLVSLSEIKEEDKYQAMLDSIRKQFGYYESTDSLVPGERRKNAAAKIEDGASRAPKLNTKMGGDKTQAPSGEYPRVRIIEEGSQTTIGTSFQFVEQSHELSPQNRDDLDRLAGKFLGKPHMIEVRGHTSRRPPEETGGIHDNWDLAYQRCRAAAGYLEEMGVEPWRIRLTVAGEHHPIDPRRIEGNARVDVFLLDELAVRPADLESEE